MTTSWHCFGRSKRSKVLILPVRGAENHPPGKAPQDTPKASLLDPSWGAQAAPWGAKKGPKKSPGTGGKFAKKSSQIGPQRVPQGPCLGRAGRARPGRPGQGRPGRRSLPGPGPGQPGPAHMLELSQMHHMIEFSQLHCVSFVFETSREPALLSSLATGYGRRLATDDVWIQAALGCRQRLVTDGVWLHCIGPAECANCEQFFENILQVTSATHGKRGGGCWPKALDIYISVSNTHLTLPTKRIV